MNLFVISTWMILENHDRPKRCTSRLVRWIRRRRRGRRRRRRRPRTWSTPWNSSSRRSPTWSRSSRPAPTTSCKRADHFFFKNALGLRQQTNPRCQNSEITDGVVAHTRVVWVTARTGKRTHVVTTPLFIFLAPWW